LYLKFAKGVALWLTGAKTNIERFCTAKRIEWSPNAKKDKKILLWKDLELAE
jgi:hypothetical protein